MKTFLLHQIQAHPATAAIVCLCLVSAGVSAAAMIFWMWSAQLVDEDGNPIEEETETPPEKLSKNENPTH